MSFDWKKTLATIAPALATALGGPLAGVATQAISAQLLGKPDGNEAEIAAAIQTGGTDALLKLKQADQDFAVRMRELDLDIDRIHASDRASARDRQVKTGDLTPAVLAGVITVGFFSVLLFMLLRGVPQTGGEALLVLLGALGAAWGSVVSYYYGSSKGSADKNALLGKRSN